MLIILENENLFSLIYFNYAIDFILSIIAISVEVGSEDDIVEKEIHMKSLLSL